MAESRLFRPLVLITLAASLALIITSSLMHVGNVGMGSQDWPAAYGLIIEHGAEVNAAAAILPTAAIERAHRAIASTLLVLIIAVVMMVLRQRKVSGLSVSVPMMALGLSLFLALLGVWFGSPLRYPAVVILNLVGGIGLFALFWWLTLDIYAGPKWNMGRVGNNIRAWAIVGLFVLIITIVLGAWTDAYYAALACTSFPDCHGQWWPGMKLMDGLALLGTLDVDAHGKVVIDGSVAAAIHMAHRLGALLAFVVIAGLGIRAWCMGGRCRMAGAVVLLLLVIQVVLGVAAVIADLPLAVVASHSSLSAVMVISILTLAHRGWISRWQGVM